MGHPPGSPPWVLSLRPEGREKRRRGEGGEGVALSTPKSIGDGVYVLCQLQLRIAHGGYSSVYRGGLRVQEEPEPRPVVIKAMMLANREDETMAANEISLLNQLGNHDRSVHLMATRECRACPS